MAKKLSVPSGTGKTIEPKREQTPLSNMTHPKEKVKRSDWPRTTICINPELYKKFQIKVKENDTTVTAVLEKAMRAYIGE